MAKARGIDAKLSRLKLLRDEPADPTFIEELQQSIHDKSNLVVADAAEIVGARMVSELAGELATAFDRFMINAEETDKLCKAKVSIIETLNKLEFNQEDIFFKAFRHVQLEPRWGGSDDTAAELRGVGAFGLVRIGYRDVILLLVDLLNDPEKLARTAAVQALASTGSVAAIPLLRFKAKTGDKESEVVAECFNALISLDPKKSIPFVAAYLSSSDEGVQEGAAFALGESRQIEALDILKQYWPISQSGSMREVVLLAIAMTRLPAGIDFLIDVLANEPAPIAMSAILALAIHRHNPSVKERSVQVIANRNDAKLKQHFRIKFAD